VGLPHNVVSSTSKNKHTGRYSAEFLQEKWEAKYMIKDIEFSNHKITDVHADIDFSLVSRLATEKRRYA